jgi:hypothetical protein
VATNVAVGCGSSTVDLEDIEWAIKFSDRSVDAAVGGREKYMHEYFAFPKYCEEVLTKIGSDSRRFRTEAELRNDFRNNSKTGYDLDNVLRQLQREGRILRGTHKGQPRPRRATGGYSLNPPSPGFRKLRKETFRGVGD